MPGPSAPSREGTLVDGRYRLARPIGHGGMGEVWEALHEGIGRKVAVKILHRQYARDAEVVARFHREARTASLIGDPRIVDVLDMGQLEDDSPFLVMELLHGETLAELLHREGTLPTGKAIRLAIEIAHALGAAHDKGIVHRDLKPDNVFLVGPRPPQQPRGDSIQIKVLDFGIAKIRAASEPTDGPGGGLTQTGTAVGTPTYMSPEQASGLSDVDARTDVWSLGVLLYRMLAGTTPFVADSYALLLVAILSQPHTPIRKHREGLPKELIGVIDAMLAKDRAVRPGSMAEAVSMLEPFASWAGAGPSQPRAPLAERPTEYVPSPPAVAWTSSPAIARPPPKAPVAPSAPALFAARGPTPAAARIEPVIEPTALDGATVRTPVSSARLRPATAPLGVAAPGGVGTPGSGRALTLEELLSDVPTGATIKGMYLTQIFARHADRAQVLDLAGVKASRWVAFSDAPFTDWVRLVDASARLRFSASSPGGADHGARARALRSVTRDAYDAFVESLAGRVIFGALGNDLPRILEAFPRFEVNIKPLTIRHERRSERHHRLTFAGFGVAVVEGLLLGIVEGAVLSCGVRATTQLESSGGPTTVDIRW